MFRVLTMNNKVITISSQSVTKKRPNKYAAALDCEAKTVSQNDIVKIIEGAYKGNQGQVKYLYRHFAFCYAKTFSENAGYFVATTRQLMLASNSRNASSLAAAAMNQGYMSPRIHASPMHPSQQMAGGASSRHGGSTNPSATGSSSVHGGSSMGKSPRTPLQAHQQAKAGATRRNIALVGKTVRITQGSFNFILFFSFF
jgi:transcription elongation factor